MTAPRYAHLSNARSQVARGQRCRHPAGYVATILAAKKIN
jgi:hypothetical protein